MRRTSVYLLAVLLSGCVPQVASEDLIGRWARVGRNEAIALNRDRTFTYLLWDTEGRRVGSGEWALIGHDRAPRVILKYRSDFRGQRATASLNVVRAWNGQLQLSADDERRRVFTKEPLGTE